MENDITDQRADGVTLLTAQQYTQRGWAVIPVPHRSKNPGFKGWERLRLSAECLPSRFKGSPKNIGVLLGEPSGWLIDIDMDHPRVVELAPKYLPPTSAVFGRPSNPRSHWLYRATSPVVSKQFRSKSAGMIVELRSTGGQTVFPPSVHESGEDVSWCNESIEPAEVHPDVIIKSVKQLAEAVLIELGEKASPSKGPNRQTALPSSGPESKRLPQGGERSEQCLATMRRITHVDNQDGSLRLFVCACRAVEYDLDDATTLATIRKYSKDQPFPRSWTDAEILKRVRDAEKTCRRGKALEFSADGCIPLGNRNPLTNQLVLSHTQTLPTASSFVHEFHMHPEGRTLHCYAGMLSEWRDNRYCELEDYSVKQRLQIWLHDAQRYQYNQRTRSQELVDFQSNPSTVNAALESLRAFVHLPATTLSPSWLDYSLDSPHPTEIVACRSSLLHLPTMRLLPSTPRFFTTNALDFDHDPKAPTPMAWHGFLHRLFDGDIESLDLLQEWFGYCLTGDTSQQKMLLIVGPRRSGKGTIARVLAKLIGAGNVCGPTTSGLSGPFGLQSLIGKSLAIVSDARFSGDNIATVVERLLCISGEDTLTIDRKNIASVTLKLPTRFMFLTNEFPKLSDSSGALAGRFVVLRFTESFYGREDKGLTAKLLLELPGILNWAIEGWQRLHERGYFVVPSSVRAIVEEIEDLSSPVSAFVRDECVVGAGHRVWVGDLYEAWKGWCDREGRTLVTTRQSFGRDLASAVCSITRRRGAGDQTFYEGIDLKRSQQ
ncbi:MAG: phage/plasmid primase, P4 family [Planctomycetota bacterium]|nr:phage/plasmid primase, P4 family [Planctomycetota bacterium]